MVKLRLYMKEDIGYPYRVRLVKYLGKAIQDTRKKKDEAIRFSRYYRHKCEVH